jgi:predicted PP-loop superfamily ATPase
MVSHSVPLWMARLRSWVAYAGLMSLLQEILFKYACPYRQGGCHQRKPQARPHHSSVQCLLGKVQIGILSLKRAYRLLFDR